MLILEEYVFVLFSEGKLLSKSFISQHVFLFFLPRTSIIFLCLSDGPFLSFPYHWCHLTISLYSYQMWSLVTKIPFKEINEACRQEKVCKDSEERKNRRMHEASLHCSPYTKYNINCVHRVISCLFYEQGFRKMEDNTKCIDGG